MSSNLDTELIKSGGIPPVPNLIHLTKQHVLAVRYVADEESFERSESRLSFLRSEGCECEAGVYVGCLICCEF